MGWPGGDRCDEAAEDWRCYHYADLQGGLVCAVLDDLVIARYVTVDELLGKRQGPGRPRVRSGSRRWGRCWSAPTAGMNRTAGVAGWDPPVGREHLRHPQRPARAGTPRRPHSSRGCGSGLPSGCSPWPPGSGSTGSWASPTSAAWSPTTIDHPTNPHHSSSVLTRKFTGDWAGGG